MKDKIKEYLSTECTDGELIGIVREINMQDKSLDNLDMCYNNEEFYNYYFEKPSQLFQAIKEAEILDVRYNATDEFILFDSHGDIETFTRELYVEEIKKYIDDVAEGVVELYKKISLPYHLKEKIKTWKKEMM